MKHRELSASCGCAAHCDGTKVRPSAPRLRCFFVIHSDIDEFCYSLCMDCQVLWEECFEFGSSPGIWARIPLKRVQSACFWASLVRGDNPFPGRAVTQSLAHFTEWVRQLEQPVGIYRGI